MKEISNYLQRFLKTEFQSVLREHSNNNNNNNKSMFSTISKNMLEKIYKHMIDASKVWTEQTIHSETINFETDDVPEHHCLSEQIKEICDSIKTNKKMGKKSTFSVGGRQIVVWLIYPFAPNDPIHKVSQTKADHFFHSCIHKIFMWLYIAAKYAKSECSRNMNLYLYFTDHFKVLPTHSDTIGQINVNTAFTWSKCSDTNDIHLFREEEWFKVLIHETFHNMMLDFGSMDPTQSRKEILDIFPVESEVNLYETYCEMWAEIINVMFVAHFSESVENITNFDKILKTMEKHIQYEQAFSAFQCVKVLHFFKLTYKNLHEQTAESEHKRKMQYKEDSNILAYYILKSIAMVHVNEFIEWNVKHNKSSLDFNKTSENVMEYCSFFREHYTSPEYLKNVQIMETWFQSKKYKHDKNSLEAQTMRMSVFEL